MKNKLIVILFFWTTFVSNAKDTTFITAPGIRSWNPQYLQQKFNDEFIGTSLNTTIWDVDQCKSRGYQGNNEGEPNNITVSNGTLKLTARYSPGNIDNNCWEGTHFVSNFTTAEMWSKWNRYKYGSFEARCFMPRGDHYYYAYWLWGPGGEGYPKDWFTSEIDIAEGCEWKFDGSHHNMKSTFHLWPQPGDEIPIPDDTSFGYGNIYEEAWHIYKIIWNPYEVIFYIDSNEVWRRSRYYTGSDIKANDVGMNQIRPNVLYHERAWFPNDEMATVLQMHNTQHTLPSSLPASMEVDYVRVKQFFLSPEITVPPYICSTGIVTMDVVTEATNITWQLTPSKFFTTTSGSGKTANIVRSPGASGLGKITYTFQMPSGETFTAEKEIIVGSPSIGTITFAMDAPPRRFTTFIEDVPTATSYNWYLNGVKNNTYHETSAVFPRKSPFCGVSYRVEVEAINPCGTSGKTRLDIFEPSCFYSLLLSPNPTSSETTVELVNGNGETLAEDIEWSLDVYDQSQSLKAKVPKVKINKHTIKTSDWKDGIYVVHATIGEEIISEKLMVKH